VDVFFQITGIETAFWRFEKADFCSMGKSDNFFIEMFTRPDSDVG
jgi:hypothetical protein